MASPNRSAFVPAGFVEKVRLDFDQPGLSIDDLLDRTDPTTLPDDEAENRRLARNAGAALAEVPPLFADGFLTFRVNNLAGNSEVCFKTHDLDTGDGAVTPRSQGLVPHVLEDGKLKLRAYDLADFPSLDSEDYDDLNHMGAIVSLERFSSQKYGYWESRLKINNLGPGHHFSLWLLPVRPRFAASSAIPEVDILEAVDSNTSFPEGGLNLFAFNNHGDGTFPLPGDDGGQVFRFLAPGDSDPDFEGEFNDSHTFGFEWDPVANELRWTVDGALVKSSSNWSNDNFELYLLMTWETRVVEGDFPNQVNEPFTTWPAEVEVDYIRVYEQPQSIGILDDWALVASSAVAAAAGVSFPVSLGARRGLLVAIGEEHSTGDVTDVAYGGEAMEQLAFQQAVGSFVPSASLWFLDESGLQAATDSDIVVTFDDTHNGQLRMFAASYEHVAQTTALHDVHEATGAGAIAAAAELDTTGRGLAVGFLVNSAGGSTDAGWSGASEQIEELASSTYHSIATATTDGSELTITPSSASINDNCFVAVALAASPLVVNVNQAAETDTAQGVTLLQAQTVAVGQASETDTAQPITPQADNTPLAYADLEFFWVGDEGVSDTAGAITSWVDRTAGAYDLTVPGGANSPTVADENGLASVETDNTGEHLEVTDAALDDLWAGGTNTLSFAFKLNNLTTPGGSSHVLIEKGDFAATGWLLSMPSTGGDAGKLVFAHKGTSFSFQVRCEAIVFDAGDLIAGSFTWDGNTDFGTAFTLRLRNPSTGAFDVFTEADAGGDLTVFTAGSTIGTDAGEPLSIGNRAAATFEAPFIGEALGVWFRAGSDVSLDEAYIGRWIASAPTVVAVGQASETDTAQSIAGSKIATIGQAAETDTAQSITPVTPGAQIIQLGRASETDTANKITPFLPAAAAAAAAERRRRDGGGGGAKKIRLAYLEREQKRYQREREHLFTMEQQAFIDRIKWQFGLDDAEAMEMIQEAALNDELLLFHPNEVLLFERDKAKRRSLPKAIVRRAQQAEARHKQRVQAIERGRPMQPGPDVVDVARLFAVGE